MAQKRRVKDEAIFVALFALIILFAVIYEWWKTHQVLGFTILGVLILSVGFLFYRSQTLRKRTANKAKEFAGNLVLEDVASDREPVPPSSRKEIYIRSHSRCENEMCTHNGSLHIHHIDGNHNNNKLFNLIALCPNCHDSAHRGKFTETQLHNWVSRDFKRLMAQRQNRAFS